MIFSLRGNGGYILFIIIIILNVNKYEFKLKYFCLLCFCLGKYIWFKNFYVILFI